MYFLNKIALYVDRSISIQEHDEPSPTLEIDLQQNPMGKWKRDVTPVHQHWSYIPFALTHILSYLQYIDIGNIIVLQEVQNILVSWNIFMDTCVI